jgi:hypothetical protein
MFHRVTACQFIEARKNYLITENNWTSILKVKGRDFCIAILIKHEHHRCYKLADNR